uniref:SPARK domain-containing protein n=1 Tax=Quercus lobata TaxID=97700 RepID=A0A7N2L492_QUELO
MEDVLSFSVADKYKILQTDPSEAFCPLNFDVLRKLVIKGAHRPAFRDIPTQRHYFLEGYAWFHLSIFELMEWISKGCTNITSKAEFESLIPESKFRAVKLYCNQSLENTSACELCTKSLLSLDFSLRASNTKLHTIVLSGAIMGFLGGIFGACSTVWFLWIRQMKAITEKTNFAKDETGLILGMGSISGSTNLFKFKYEDIKKATMNFSRENLIGKGGYGNVYKGILPDGSHVAFKRSKNCSAAGDATFSHKVEVIARRALDVIEEGMPELGSCQMMEQYVLIAVLCAHPVLHAWPTMEQVVKILETDSANWSVFRLF